MQTFLVRSRASSFVVISLCVVTHLGSFAVVREVSDYTGFPEMLDGRVKTLHPLVHGGASLVHCHL